MLTNPIIRQRKINRAKQAVSRCREADVSPPKWALHWSKADYQMPSVHEAAFFAAMRETDE